MKQLELPLGVFNSVRNVWAGVLLGSFPLETFASGQWVMSNCYLKDYKGPITDGELFCVRVFGACDLYIGCTLPLLDVKDDKTRFIMGLSTLAMATAFLRQFKKVQPATYIMAGFQIATTALFWFCKPKKSVTKAL